MIRRLSPVALLLIQLCSFGGPALADTPAKSHEHHHEQGTDRATTQHRFEDAKYWSGVFDDPKRDAWQKPAEVIQALELKPGDTVADVGAGTGYFGRWLSQAVGEGGTVFLADVEPNLVTFMRERAEKEQTANVIPVLASYDNPRLPRASLDVLLMVDTYHHIDHRKRYFERVKTLLKPGGRVAVVDFYKRELPIGPKPSHKLEQSQVISEMKAAGFELARELNTLPYQYILLFRASK